MSGKDILEKIQSGCDNFLQKINGTITYDVPLNKYTWLKTGGRADILYQPFDEKDLSIFLSKVPKTIPVVVLGHGSNVLVRDGGVAGIVVRLGGKKFAEIKQIDKNHIKVGAALPDKQLALQTQKMGLSGFEFYAGIVGNVGGALRMNGGAHGRETKDCVVEVYALDRQGKHITLSAKDMGYDYRYSGVGADLIFTSCLLSGEIDSPKNIGERIEQVQQHRQQSQPIRERTGGSTFKNPPNHSAWKLLEQAGMRGKKYGGAQFSEMHCNFLINTGTATSYDFEYLGEQAREIVYSQSGILLEWEIKKMGAFARGKKVQVFQPNNGAVNN